MKGLQQRKHFRESSGMPLPEMVPLRTNLMELVSAVSEEVEEKFPDPDGLVARVVFHLLGGEGDPLPAMRVRLPRG